MTPDLDLRRTCAVVVGTAGKVLVNGTAAMVPAEYANANLKDVFFNGDVGTIVGAPVLDALTILERSTAGAWEQAPNDGIGGRPLSAGWSRFAVGDSGLIVERTATAWTLMPNPPAATDLFGVAGARNEVFVVGKAGAIWRYAAP